MLCMAFSMFIEMGTTLNTLRFISTTEKSLNLFHVTFIKALLVTWWLLLALSRQYPEENCPCLLNVFSDQKHEGLFEFDEG